MWDGCSACGDGGGILEGAEDVVFEGGRMGSGGRDVDGLLRFVGARAVGPFGVDVLPEVGDGVDGMNILQVAAVLGTWISWLWRKFQGVGVGIGIGIGWWVERAGW
jgi:hypothetical protein